MDPPRRDRRLVRAQIQRKPDRAAELEPLANELSAILGWIEQLGEVVRQLNRLCNNRIKLIVATTVSLSSSNVSWTAVTVAVPLEPVR